MVAWTALSYAITIAVLVLFAIYALVYSTVFVPKNATSVEALATLKGFIAIRNTQGMWRIAWSMFAGSLGAWTITAPADFASFAGWLGGLMYGLACGIPLVFIAFYGQMIKDKYPHACSVGDFIDQRFGPSARLLVVLVCLFNMCIFMLAELTTIGSLFADFVGSVNYPIIAVVAVLTTGYCAYGGILVSIVTDQVQSILAILLLSIAVIYVAVTFKEELEPGFGAAAPQLNPNESSYASIFTLPISLLCSSFFNEGMWQRVWAAESPKALYGGSMIAAVLVSSAVVLYALSGFFVTWAGLTDENTNPNLLLFQVFKSSGESSSATVSSWIQLLVLVLAAVMNQSAVDSLISGITGTLSTYFLPGRPIKYARILTAFIMIPIVIAALGNARVLAIFLTTNMLATCTFVPVVIAGFFDDAKWRAVFSETPYVLSVFTAVIVVTAYGIGNKWDPEDPAGSIRYGASYSWYENLYEWDYFLCALLTSTFSFLIYALITHAANVLGLNLVGLSGLLGCASCAERFGGPRFVDSDSSSGDTDSTDLSLQKPSKDGPASGPMENVASGMFAWPEQQLGMVPVYEMQPMAVPVFYGTAPQQVYFPAPQPVSAQYVYPAY